MSLLHRHPLDEASPVEPLRPVPATTRWPLRIDEQARSIAALAEMRAEAPVAFFAAINTEPLELTDWSAQLAEEWCGINMRLDSFAAARKAWTETFLAKAVVPSLSVADFIAELDDDRGAMLADVNAERVLLAELAELAPFTAKAEVAK